MSNLRHWSYLFLSVLVTSGCGDSSDRVAPEEIGANSRFGTAVTTTDAVRFVGAPGHAGAGTVFTFSNPGGRKVEASITPFQGGVGDMFGAAIDALGNVVLIGAPVSEIDGSLGGRAFVYRYSVEQSLWLQEEDLEADEPHDLDYFGSSVALSPTLAVVGAPGDDEMGSNTGAAFVFRNEASGWSRVAKLVPPDGSDGDRFGESVAVDEDRILVGSPFAVDGTTRPGAAYLFVISDTTAQLTRRLLPQGSHSDQGFGLAVALHGSTAFVGAPGGGNPGAPGGTVSIFDLESGSDRPAQTLARGSSATEAGFGAAVDVEGTSLLVGAQRQVGDHAGPGSAFIYTGSGTNWTLSSELPGSDASRADGFGASVALTSSTAIIGASGDAGSGPNAGAAYFYSGGSGGWQ